MFQNDHVDLSDPVGKSVADTVAGGEPEMTVVTLLTVVTLIRGLTLITVVTLITGGVFSQASVS